MNDVTRLLQSFESGDAEAADRLMPLVYHELRKLAADRLRRERTGQTLDATSLVHEAYLRLVGDHPDQPWDGRGQFFAAAAEAMRRILVDRARRKATEKHGGELRRVPLVDVTGREAGVDLLALDEALIELRGHDEAAAKLVTLRYFGGLGTRRPPRPWA